MHQFTVNIVADTPRTAAEMCKTASEALHAGTLRLSEERHKGSVEYAWGPGLAALTHPAPAVGHRVAEALPSLYAAMAKDATFQVADVERAPFGVAYLDATLPDGTVYRFAVSGNEAALVRTVAPSA